MNNRQRLIEAAAEIFHRQGFADTSLDDVLSATGVARSNLYYHFDSKMDLAVAVVRHWVEVYDTEVIRPALEEPELTPRERLEVLFRRAAALQDPDCGNTGCPLGHLAMELNRKSPEIRELMDGYLGQLRERLTHLFQAGLEGGAGAVPPEHMADLAVCILEGGLLLAHLRQRPNEVERAGGTLVRLLESGAPARV